MMAKLSLMGTGAIVNGILGSGVTMRGKYIHLPSLLLAAIRLFAQLASIS